LNGVGEEIPILPDSSALLLNERTGGSLS
jgi:hypothetical protein